GGTTVDERNEHPALHLDAERLGRVTVVDGHRRPGARGRRPERDSDSLDPIGARLAAPGHVLVRQTGQREEGLTAYEQRRNRLPGPHGAVDVPEYPLRAVRLGRH